MHCQAPLLQQTAVQGNAAVVASVAHTTLEFVAPEPVAARKHSAGTAGSKAPSGSTRPALLHAVLGSVHVQINISQV